MAIRRVPPEAGAHASRHHAFSERQARLENAPARAHPSLADMLRDSYFPRPLVERGVGILVDLCAQFEAEKPTTPEAVYTLTHRATEAFNDLQEAFFEADSEFETDAREAIAADFGRLLAWYGHSTLDVEEAISPRDW